MEPYGGAVPTYSQGKSKPQGWTLLCWWILQSWSMLRSLAFINGFLIIIGLIITERTFFHGSNKGKSLPSFSQPEGLLQRPLPASSSCCCAGNRWSSPYTVAYIKPAGDLSRNWGCQLRMRSWLGCRGLLYYYPLIRAKANCSSFN